LIEDRSSEFFIVNYNATTKAEDHPMIKNKFKKISIIETNNTALSDNHKHLKIPKSIEDKDLKMLKKYVLQNIDLKKYTDPEVIIRSLEWISTRWEHNGMNQPPKNISSYQILLNAKKGQKYRCVEYGKVLADLLKSFGYISRSIGLKTTNVAYGGFGMGHVAAEVWSNTLSKWIFVDPQFGIYVKHRGQFLNYYEMFQLKRDSKFDAIEFIPTDGFLKYNSITKEELVGDYKNFLANYFGYMDTWYKIDGKTIVSLTLPLEGKAQFVTFQGLPESNTLFTNNMENLYYPLNRVLVLMSYKGKCDFSAILKKHEIKTDDDYIEKMHAFSAIPKYNLKFVNNMPWFNHYEVKIANDCSWTKIKADSYHWDLADGINDFKVRCVNKAGVIGPVTSIIVEYK